MPNQTPAPLTPETVSAILRDPDSPHYPTQITVFCDHCGTENTGDYMVSEDMSSEERLAVARAHLVANVGWEHDEYGDDFCPEHASKQAPRTNTPDVVTVDADGHKHTTIKLKRACNGCRQHLGDVDNRDVDDNGNLTDVRGECTHCRPLVEFEAQGCTTWQLTPRDFSRIADEVDRLRPWVFSKGYWQEVDGKNQVVGLRVGEYPDRVVARFGDWLIRHPDGSFTVHAAPAAVETGE